MILTKDQTREIERHLFKHMYESEELMERRLDILLKSRPAINGQPHGGGVSDGVGASVIALEERTKHLSAWCDVISKTFERFRGTHIEDLMNERYRLRRHPEKICSSLSISLPTFYVWREDVLLFAFCTAMNKGLMSLSYKA